MFSLLVIKILVLSLIPSTALQNWQTAIVYCSQAESWILLLTIEESQRFWSAGSFINQDIDGRKNIKVVHEDLVSWLVRKQKFEQENCIFVFEKIFIFFWNIFLNKNNIPKLVVDNAISEEIVQNVVTGS